MSNPDNTRDSVNRLSKAAGFARTYGPISDLYGGLDHRNAGSSFQKNTDHQGLVLFTRPDMNLSYNNVMADRKLRPLLSDQPKSLHRSLRLMLDPSLFGKNVVSDIFDQRQAFIPILTNTLINLSGFPDETSNAYTAPEGMRRETFGFIDDVSEINGSYDLTASFANIQGDPITKLFSIWNIYTGNVYTGKMVPYPDNVIQNRVDYETRIWRLRLDKSKRYVTKIGCANAGFPLASPLGSHFNYSNDTPYDSENDQISIPFRCFAAEYEDPILYEEFNLTVGYFNPAMRGSRASIEQLMFKIPHRLANEFNFQGYPRINTETLELEWWIDKEAAARVISGQEITPNAERVSPMTSGYIEDILNSIRQDT